MAQRQPMVPGNRPPVQRMNTENMVDISSGVVSSVLCGSIIMQLVAVVPACYALYVAYTRWDQPCDQHLQLWLAVEGGKQVLLLLPAILAIRQERAKGDRDFLSYVYRKKQAEEANQPFEVDSDMESQLRDKSPSFASTAIRIAQCPSLIWDIVGLVWYCQSSDKTCDQTLRHTTLGMLLFISLFPCLACCCVLCFGMGGLIGNMPMDSGSSSDSE
eukprot:CAMPEP_0181433986 /NCGR_PEP_ID=MMETSP1110-20121109/19583_1 /TAXON_ID=174948 /ORGANISM="Symbiodinium sp., Strain CCMP421" /LENGTH=215 /DNA_ID=CAMNT_0023557473 /DNA_START=44 /DNA_END=691 /DNA_ORIENTATION=-